MHSFGNKIICALAALFLLISLTYLFSKTNFLQMCVMRYFVISDRSEAHLSEAYSALGTQKYTFSFKPVTLGNSVVWNAEFIREDRKRLRLRASNLMKFVNVILEQADSTSGLFSANHLADIPKVRNTCLKLPLPENGILSDDCYDLLEKTLTVGGMPVEVKATAKLPISLSVKSPPYKLSSIYLHPGTINDNISKYHLQSSLCPVVSEKRRNYLYWTLKHWISLASENNILWWLSSGSLIGAVRDGEMIPYDHDMDIFVLGSAEKQMRKCARKRGYISPNQFNLIMRPYDHCSSTSGALLLDCSAQAVKRETDICTICQPLGRMFYNFDYYVDIFAINIQMYFNEDLKPVEFGYYDESCKKLFNNFSGIFPLKHCKFMGLDAACPNKPELMLEGCYGKGFLIPHKLCNATSKQWVLPGP